MILIKCLGAALVVISGCGLGLQLAGQWRGRLALLEQLRKMIHLLKGEIVYANSTLEEALCRVGSRTDGGLGKMFSSAGEEISRLRESYSAILFLGSDAIECRHNSLTDPGRRCRMIVYAGPGCSGCGEQTDAAADRGL